MRNLILILFIFLSSTVWADEFTVFEKDGYFGIKDRTGNVTVPAVYERLGWSNGSTEVVKGVIGFKKNNLWGLITVRNKSLTGQKFYTIQPIASDYFKASIKGKFSNHLFHGILDERGKTVVSFNYFAIEAFGPHWLVSDFDGKRQFFGVVSNQNQVLIPSKYASIEEQNSLYLAREIAGKISLYNSQGITLELGLDSLFFKDGWIAFRDGYAGFLSGNGQTIHGFNYKNFEVKEESVRPIRFPEWTIYEGDSVLLRWKCDSVSVGENELLIAYLNGAHHLLLKNATLLNNQELILKAFVDDHLIIQNSKTRKWSVLGADGKKLIQGYDSIYASNGYYVGSNEKGWWLLSESGETINRLPFQQLRQGYNGQFIARRNGHWGIFNPTDNDITYKYDDLIVFNSGYLVDYLNRWGAMDENGTWIIRPEFAEIISVGDFLVGRRGKGYTFYYKGEHIYKTTSKPVSQMGFDMLIKDVAGYGLLNSFGEVWVFPEYDTIRYIGNHFELVKEGVAMLKSASGKTLIHPEEGYQQVKDHGEDYFLIKKEDRWGFVDEQGRLRISNRYDAAGPFSEGLAPIKLREKWGFIDKNETIRVQPYYDSITAFYEGASVVSQSGLYGLLDMGGQEVLELIWKSIHRLHTGNYLVQDMESRFGLVNGSGSFILRPAYDYLEDFGGRVLVSNNGAWGVMNYSGQQIFKINHEAVKIVGDYTMIKD